MSAPPDPSAVLGLLARAVADLAIPIVRDALAAEQTVGQLVAVDEALGCSRRHACELCRAGRIPGAVMVANRWRAPRKGVEAYLSTRGRRARKGAVEADDDTTEDTVLRELGFARHR